MTRPWNCTLILALAAAHLACSPRPVPWGAYTPSRPLSSEGAFDAEIELRSPNSGEIHGQHVTFDGIAEGLAWPALDRALGPRAPSAVVSIRASRDVRVLDLLRVVWTLRANDVRVQTADATGVMRTVELGAKRTGAAALPGCHLALFLRPDGSLRVAAPGGPREVRGQYPAESLANDLMAERATCVIKYVAFGAESDETPWGAVFDVMTAVDREKSAGDARYVLGQAMHIASH